MPTAGCRRFALVRVLTKIGLPAARKWAMAALMTGVASNAARLVVGVKKSFWCRG
jgi:hypothetical protein